LPGPDPSPDLARNHRQKAGARGPGRLPLAACIVVAGLFCIRLWAAGPRLLVARWAPQPALTPSLRRKIRASRADRFVPSRGRCEAAPPLSNAPVRPHRKTPARQLPSVFPIRHSCCKDGARSRESGANIEQLSEPAQMAVDNSKAIGSSRQPGRDKGVLAKVSEQNPPGRHRLRLLADSDLAQARTDASSPYARARLESKEWDRRRMVAVRGGDHRVLFWQQRLDAIHLQKARNLPICQRSTDKVPAGN